MKISVLFGMGTAPRAAHHRQVPLPGATRSITITAAFRQQVAPLPISGKDILLQAAPLSVENTY
jgi:hypothetical protein